MPSISRKLSQKRRSHVSKRKSSVHKRKLSAPRRKSVAVKRTRSMSGGGTAKFWCMKCKNFSKNDIDRYERGRTGGMFAKGRCKDCDTKVSVIVKADDVRR